MLTNTIEINGCLHYIADLSLATGGICMIGDPNFSEIDTTVEHPLGAVFKPKSVIDTPVRYVFQKDNSMVVFNLIEWYNKINPFTKPKRTLYQVFKDFYEDLFSISTPPKPKNPFCRTTDWFSRIYG
jgi:hypothetical protein